MKLAGKKAIVTGASRSIGRAIAEAFAKEGADVLISYRSDEAGARKTLEGIERSGRRGKAVYANFDSKNSVEVFFREALEFLGQTDILVNNAAGYNTSPFVELKLEEFQSLMQAGLTAPFLLSQLAARHMIENKIHGNIINITSISGVRAYPNRAAHSTVKAALNMLTQSMALELGPYGIRVNAIAPGSTPYDDSGDTSDFVTSGIPLGRVGVPQDQARAALFLASDESSWMTGQIIAVDGGHILSLKD